MKIVKTSLVDQIYQELKADILELRLGWGERVNVNELQQKYGVSSTPIREAVNRLQKEGLIDYTNNLGARVTQLTREDLLEIQSLAFKLDLAALEFAMAGDKKAEMAQALHLEILKYKKSEDEAEKLACIETFMDILYSHAGNKRLVALADNIRSQQHMLRNTYRRRVKTSAHMDDHEQMLKAIEEGNFSKAAEALKDNYTKGTELLLHWVLEN